MFIVSPQNCYSGGCTDMQISNVHNCNSNCTKFTNMMALPAAGQPKVISKSEI